MKSTKGNSGFSDVENIVAESNSSTNEGLVLTSLSRGKFSRLLTEGRVTLTTSNLSFAGRIESELYISISTFQKLASIYGKFLGLFKQANRAAIKSSRRAGFALANHVFDNELLPELQRAGINVERSQIKTTSAFYHLQDLPLNSQFQWMGTTVDLNTAAGIRSLLSDTNSGMPSAKEALVSHFAKSIFAHAMLTPLLTAPPTQLLTVEQRCMVFLAATTMRELQSLCHQEMTDRLNAAETVIVPVELKLILPGQNVSLPGRVRALIYFEEVAHFFQFLNEGPLTATGEKIAHELADGNMFYRSCAEALGFRGSKLLVLENDLVSILYELGVKPPARLLNFPYEYQRRTISDLFYYQ